MNEGQYYFIDYEIFSDVLLSFFTPVKASLNGNSTFADLGMLTYYNFIIQKLPEITTFEFSFV